MKRLQNQTTPTISTPLASTLARLLHRINFVHRARVKREVKRIRYLRDSFHFLGILERWPATSWPEYDASRALLDDARRLLHAARQLLGQRVVSAADVTMARKLMNQAYFAFTDAAKNCPEEPDFFCPLPERVMRNDRGSAGGYGGDGGSDSGGSADSGGGNCGGGGDGGGGGCD